MEPVPLILRDSRRLVRQARRSTGSRRRGLTLIELVMVVSLLVLLAAIAIPSLQLAVEGRRVREAARAVNVYLGAARNRAMATGRPVGVALQRFENESNVSMTLNQVEAPPPYAGDTTGARAQVYFGSNGLTAAFSGGFTQDMVRVGDRIQFNHQGPWHRITTVTGNSVTVAADPSRLYPWPNGLENAALAPYEIRRRPRLPSETGLHAAIAKPVQLPLDAVIDLAFSGTQSQPALFSSASAGTAPVVIMFAPNGGIDRVYHGAGESPPGQAVFLLIGKRERIPPTDSDDGLANWQDGESLWVYVSPQTGMVNTVEIYPGATFAETRYYAMQAEGMGGR